MFLDFLKNKFKVGKEKRTSATQDQQSYSEKKPIITFVKTYYITFFQKTFGFFNEQPGLLLLWNRFLIKQKQFIGFWKASWEKPTRFQIQYANK